MTEMTRFWIVGMLVGGFLVGVVGRKITVGTGSGWVNPRWGEIGFLSVCTAWYVGVVLYGTPLDDGSPWLFWALLVLTGATGIFWGVVLGWTRSTPLKRWSGYGVVVGAVAALLLV